MRKYKSGTKWCFWRWTTVDTGYITRLHFIQTPFGSLHFHWINHPDPERWMHDHPATFLSIILKGGYTELRRTRAGAPKRFDRRWFNFIRATLDDQHRITQAIPGTVTMCFMGPKRREWGFHTPEGWVHWKDYQGR